MSDEELMDQRQDFESIAEELYNVDRTGIYLQAVMAAAVSFMASIGSYFAADLGTVAVVLVFIATFVPNLGVKVFAEYVKKRALVKGMRRGYVQGREDSELTGTYIGDMKKFVKWFRIYRTVDSMCYARSL